MAPLKPALLIVFVVVAVISGESAKYGYHHSTTGACARVRAGAEEGGGGGSLKHTWGEVSLSPLMTFCSRLRNSLRIAYPACPMSDLMSYFE